VLPIAVDPHLGPAVVERGPEGAGVHLEDLVIALGPERHAQLGRPFDIREEKGERAARKTSARHAQILRLRGTVRR
jgi:hypothetical protein